MHRNLIFIGHRGTRVYGENTINAFNKALEHGANYIEFDVRKTKDHHLIIIHDATLERTTNGTGLINELTYDEIKRYKTKLTREQIPLLSDVIDLFRGKIKFMIELKEDNIQPRVIELIQKNNLIKDTIFSSRNLNQIIYIKKKFPETKICYNITKGKTLTLSDFLNLEDHNDEIFHNLDMISLKSNLINSRFIKICHIHKILALAWDFFHYHNPIDMIKILIRKGIDGILFDDYKNILVIKQWLTLH